MSGKRFVDTNIWVYAHLEKPSDEKWSKANEFVETSENLVISTQVMSEYYAVMLRNRADDALIQSNLEAMSQFCEVSPVSLTSIRSAHRIRLGYHFSYWDSLIIASALETGCNLLYSEDMQAGQEIEGCLRIENPLL
jgi:predicted nucleic acid-binding protein